ncbi:hypothetical protein Tco_0941180 [Tanacetum coccineum]|uniref:Uncharacterized protein n=1 Tax=Tanacetum coccineum TaxID=301880 RepID=A0ABQ5DQ53_9ASTR
MNDPNITMEEYIRLEEEKARKCGKVFNWETAKYGRIWYDEDIHDLRSIENEFPAIAFNDSLNSSETLSCEPTVSSLNDEIDFKISFDDSDDEDYTVIFNKNSFYNDTQTSKSDLLTELILSPQHIDEFYLNDETSLSEYDEEEQNVLYFNDLFAFNIIQPDDLKSEKDNDDKEFDIIQSSGVMKLHKDMALPPRDQRHQYLRYARLQYTDDDIVDFETRLARIYRREVHKVQVFNFGGLPNFMAEGLSARMLMEHKDAQGVSLFGEAVLDLDTPGALQFHLGGARRHLSWKHFILALGLHTTEDMETVGFGISFAGDFLGIAPSYTSIRDLILRLCHRLIACSIAGRSQAPKKVTVTDLFYLRGMDVGSINIPYLLARYLRLFTARRKSEALISGGQFVARLAEHFGLLTEERLRGLTVIAPAFLVIDMAELVRLQICVEIDDTWAWAALGPERQPNAVAGAHGATEDAPAVDEGVTTGCQDFTGTCGEINDQLGEILHMDDYMYNTTHEGQRTDISGIRWDLSGELTSIIPETYQAQYRWCQRFHSPAAARPLISLSLIFYPLSKPSSKFSTIVHMLRNQACYPDQEQNEKRE